jgi:phosphoribosylformylglycinamidine (FGAM) synthase-like enzyme
MCVGGNCGAEIKLSDTIDAANFLFNETAGTFVIEVDSPNTAKKLFKNIPYKILGKTITDKTISVTQKKNKLFTVNVEELKKSWQEPMRNIFP